MTLDNTREASRGCVTIVFSGCASMIGFVIGLAVAIVWAAWGKW